MDARTGTHGALMDGVYRYQRHVYDLTRKYYLLGRDRLIDDLAVPDAGSVLEIACGTGRNLIRIGRRYPTARLFGFDISRAMLDTAAANVARAGLSERVALAEGDATRFDPAETFGLARFDRVVISYSLSMIPDWQAALADAARHVAPGGALCVVDFGTQSRQPRLFEALLRRWLAAFHVTPRAGLADAMERTAGAVGGTAEVTSLYRDYALLGRIVRGGT